MLTVKTPGDGPLAPFLVNPLPILTGPQLDLSTILEGTVLRLTTVYFKGGGLTSHVISQISLYVKAMQQLFQLIPKSTNP